MNIKEFKKLMADSPTAWRGYEEFAFWLVETIQPKIIVELGVNYGFSLFAFASPGIGHVYGIDLWKSGGEEFGYINQHKPDNDDDFIFAHKTRELFDNVTLIRDSFHSVAKQWHQKIDVLHIDGMHTFDDVSRDYADWSPFVEDEGVILLHDLVSYKGIRDFFDLIRKPKGAFLNLDGLAIIANKDTLQKISENFQITIYHS